LRHRFLFLLVGWAIAFVSACALVPTQLSAQTSGIVRGIIVEGTQRVEADTVRPYLLVQEGDPFDPGQIDRSLKSLFATGLFADVAIRRAGDNLVVTVVENPVINRIAFEGNQRIDDETLTSEVSLRPRVIYTRTKVQNDVKRILTLYRRSGRFAATVDPKVIQLEQNRIDLVFEISEGRRTDISRIRFIGNTAYSDSRLREVIRTTESAWWRFLTADDTYDPDRLTLDRELLRRFYLSEGYTDFRVESALAELTPDRENFFITFTVEEGNRYRFGNVDIETTLRDLDPESLDEAIEVEEGEWYDAERVETTIDGLSDAVGVLGYAFVDVRPRIDRDREAREIDITFEINEGPRVFVERIDIVGNVRTLDKVIRREFRLVEGDAFNAARLRRSRQRVSDLDFFERVDIERIPGSAPDKAVIKVNVEEKSTGSLSVGAGFSTSSGVLGDIGIRERNLLGRGQDLRLNLLVGERQSQIDLGFTEPYFLDREIRAGFDLFRVSTDRQDESSFDTKSTGGALRAGYPITEEISQSWRYTLRQSEITDVPDNASRFVKAAEGEDILSEVSHTIEYDARDSRIAPTEGFFSRLTTDVAGLGGDVSYMRNSLGVGQYFPITDQWVLAFVGSAGYIVGLGEDIRLLDRFFIGGGDLRGFAADGVGPRDTTTEDALGGDWSYTGTAELSFPLGLPSELAIRGKVFTDIGSSGRLSDTGPEVANTGSLRASVGAGVSWASPFGPIGVDFGFPVLKEGFDQTEAIRINFGARF